MSDGNSEDNSDSNGFHNCGGCFIEIKSMSLMEAFGHKSGFKLVNNTIMILLNTKNPLATSVLLMGKKRHKGPCIILIECIVFILHGCSSLRVRKCLCRFIRFNLSEQEFGVILRLSKAIFGFGFHKVQILRNISHVKC